MMQSTYYIVIQYKIIYHQCVTIHIRVYHTDKTHSSYYSYHTQDKHTSRMHMHVCICICMHSDTFFYVYMHIYILYI